MPDRARIDALIPVRDGARYLAAAIESALAQTLPPACVIVVDDGSADESAAIAEGFGPPVTVLRQAPLGGPAALNLALTVSDAPLVAFLDADDLWLPSKLELQAAVLCERPEVDLVYGHLTEFLDGEAEARQLAIRSEPVAGIIKSTLVARRSVLDRVGHFDSEYAIVDFPEWYARCRAANVVEHVVPETVTRRRVHGENVTVLRRDATQAEYLRLARAAVERRRSSPTQP